MDHAGDLRLHRPRLDLQRIDGGAMDFVGKLKLAVGGRPAGGHEQNSGNHEVDAVSRLRHVCELARRACLVIELTFIVASQLLARRHEKPLS